MDGVSKIKSPHVKGFSVYPSKKEVVTCLQEKNIVSIEIHLSPSMVEQLMALDIKVDESAGNFLYWGNVHADASFLPHMLEYMQSIGKNTPETAHAVSSLIGKLAEVVTDYFDTQFAWIETKTFLANDTFSVPRWHVDNKFFKPHTAYKFVWALKGAQTRFGSTGDAEEFDRLTVLEIAAGRGNEENIRIRRELDGIVDELQMPGERNATLYLSGGSDPVVHSEPLMTENRLFLAIVPGTEEEIREWHERKAQKDYRKGVKNRRWYFITL